MAETLSSFLTNVGTFFTQAMIWVGDVLDIVIENPALFVLVVAIPVAGVAIGYFRRLINV